MAKKHYSGEDCGAAPAPSCWVELALARRKPSARPPAILIADEQAGEQREQTNAPREQTSGNEQSNPSSSPPEDKASPAPVPTDRDVETLQEIARRIREDHDDAAAESPRLLKMADNRSTAVPVPAAAAAAATTEPLIVGTIAAADTIEPMAPAARQNQATAPAKAKAKALQTPRNASADTMSKLAQKLAHELRTPISAMHTAAAILAEESYGPIGNPCYKTYAEDIQKSASHVLDVIAAMLDPESLQTGMPQLEFTQLDLDDLIASTLSGIKPLAEKAGLTLTAELQRRLPHVIADARSIKQILLNLLANAIKFTPAGGSITVTTHYELDGPLQIILRDNGPGMSEEQIAGVMRRPAHAVVHCPTATGQGIGLPLTLSLVQANNAEFSLASKAGDGLRATISFPKDRVVPAW